MRCFLPLLLPIRLILALSLLGVAGLARADLPPGFVRIPVHGTFDQPAGVTFDNNGRMYVWERGGRVWIVENNVKAATPLVDISDEVGWWGDHGLLGFALHPNFLENGWIYLFYAVDHYHLTNAGSPSYDPNVSEFASRASGASPATPRARRTASTAWTRPRGASCWARPPARAARSCTFARRGVAGLRQRRHPARELRRWRELRRPRRRRRHLRRVRDAGARRGDHHAGRGHRRLPGAAALVARRKDPAPRSGVGRRGARQSVLRARRAALRALARLRARLPQSRSGSRCDRTPAATSGSMRTQAHSTSRTWAGTPGRSSRS